MAFGSPDPEPLPTIPTLLAFLPCSVLARWLPPWGFLRLPSLSSVGLCPCHILPPPSHIPPCPPSYPRGTGPTPGPASAPVFTDSLSGSSEFPVKLREAQTVTCSPLDPRAGH